MRRRAGLFGSRQAPQGRVEQTPAHPLQIPLAPQRHGLLDRSVAWGDGRPQFPPHDALPGPVRELFRIGEVEWPEPAEHWPDYAAMGLTKSAPRC